MSGSTGRRPLRIAVVHGPNLNLLGVREPETYGSDSLARINEALADLAAELGCALEVFQSNSEGEILDFLAACLGRADGLVVNPAGLGHTSVALLDGLKAVALPFVEVHLSNPAAREPFRRKSLLAPAAAGVVAGFGMDSYLSGFRCLTNHLRRRLDRSGPSPSEKSLRRGEGD